MIQRPSEILSATMPHPLAAPISNILPKESLNALVITAASNIERLL